MGLLGFYLQSAGSGEDDQFARSGSRKYTAAFTPDCDENFVRKFLDPTLQINYPHPSDLGQVVSGISVTSPQEPSRFADPTDPGNPLNGTYCLWWDVDVTYGPWDPLTHTASGNPADQPIDVSFQWEVFQQPADIAWDPSTSAFVPVVNSAGDPFDPPVTRDQLRGILRVAWNSLAFDPASFFAHGNKINADVWNGFPALSIKFSPPNMPQRLYSQFLGQNYYRLEAEFAFNPNDGGWNAKPIDCGYRYNDGSGNLFKIFDHVGQPISQPALLNGSGLVLAPTIPRTYFQLEFQVYDSINFASTFTNLTTLFV
jgi:hypothetical protein